MMYNNSILWWVCSDLLTDDEKRSMVLSNPEYFESEDCAVDIGTVIVTGVICETLKNIWSIKK